LVRGPRVALADGLVAFLLVPGEAR